MPKFRSTLTAPANTNSGEWEVGFEGYTVKAESRTHGERIEEMLKAAFFLGASGAQTEIRQALGLSTVGGDVKAVDPKV